MTRSGVAPAAPGYRKPHAVQRSVTMYIGLGTIVIIIIIIILLRS